ncbi:hypothetical protein ACFRI7_32145 [Streptomyces sp. NPDC056716]|uniref:hypothetical protein n=1 Tax=unclassified Streptomyces TaxID=2593676 RepID=UPI003684AACA
MHLSPHRLSPTRLVADAFALLALASVPTLFTAVLGTGIDFGGVQWPHAVFRAYVLTSFAIIVLQLTWLAWLVSRRITTSATSGRTRALLLTALCAEGTLALSVYTVVPGGSTAGLLISSVLLGWLAYEVCRHHGIPLSAPSGEKDRATRWRTAYKQTERVYLCILYGAGATQGAVWLLSWLGPDWLPVMRTSQIEALRASGRLELILALPWTIVVEGVVIGTVGILLHTAGRPPWQIYTVIAVPEILFHSYFGLPAIMMMVYAVLCAQFYIRHHRIGPLLMGHLIVDLIAISLAGESWAVRLVAGAGLGAAFFAADRWHGHPKRQLRAPVTGVRSRTTERTP